MGSGRAVDIDISVWVITVVNIAEVADVGGGTNCDTTLPTPEAISPTSLVIAPTSPPKLNR